MLIAWGARERNRCVHKPHKDLSLHYTMRVVWMFILHIHYSCGECKKPSRPIPCIIWKPMEPLLFLPLAHIVTHFGAQFHASSAILNVAFKVAVDTLAFTAAHRSSSVSAHCGLAIVGGDGDGGNVSTDTCRRFVLEWGRRRQMQWGRRHFVRRACR